MPARHPEEIRHQPGQVVCGDRAIGEEWWAITGKTSNGQALNPAARTTDGVRRQPEGRWLLAIDDPYGGPQ